MIKVYLHRTHGRAQIYTPAIYVTDLNWSTKNFLDVIEKDLARSTRTPLN